MNKRPNLKYQIISAIIALIVVGASLAFAMTKLLDKSTTIQTIDSAAHNVGGLKAESIQETALTPTPFVTPIVTLSPSDVWDAFLGKIKTKQDVKKILDPIYGRLNGAIKFENAIKWTPIDWSEQMELNYFQPSMYEKFAEVIKDVNIKKDFRNISKLIAYVRDTRDLEALKYASEIAQDVNIYVMPNGAEDLKKTTVFGASFALDEHNEAVRIDEWIKANIK